MIYDSCHSEEVTWPPLGVANWYACSMGYRSAMKISYSESPQKTSINTSSNHHRAGHVSWFGAAISDLAILGATMWISIFPIKWPCLDAHTSWTIPKQSRSYSPILCGNHRLVSNGNFKNFSPDLESPQKLDLDANWTIQFQSRSPDPITVLIMAGDSVILWFRFVIAFKKWVWVASPDCEAWDSLAVFGV